MGADEKFTLPTPEEVASIRNKMSQGDDLPTPEESAALRKELGFSGQEGDSTLGDVAEGSLIGAATMATGGYLPEIEAAVSPAMLPVAEGVLKAAGANIDEIKLPDNYEDRVKFIREQNKAAMEKAPIASTLSGIAGYAAGPMGKVAGAAARSLGAMGKASGGVEALDILSKTGKAGKVASLAVKGAGIAAAEAPVAAAEGYLFNPKETGLSREESAKLTGAFGATVPPAAAGAIGAAGKVFDKYGTKLIAAMFGPNIDYITRYLEKPELFDKAVDAETMVRQAKDILTPIFDNVQQGKATLAEANKAVDDLRRYMIAEMRFNKQQLDESLKAAKTELNRDFSVYYDNKKMVPPPLELNSFINKSLDDLQEKVFDGSERAMDIAIAELGPHIPFPNAVDSIDEILAKYVFQSGPNVGKVNPGFKGEYDSLLKWRKMLESYQENGISTMEAKDLVKELNKKISWSKRHESPGMTQSEQLGMKAVRKSIASLLEASPGYSEAMIPVRESAALLSEAQKLFGKESRRMTVLNTIDKPLNSANREVLFNLGDATKTDFRAPVEDYISVKNEAKVLRTREGKEDWMQEQPAYKDYAQAEAEIKAYKSINEYERLKRIDSELKKKAEYEYKLAMEERAAVLQEARKEVRTFNEYNTEAKLKTLIQSFNIGKKGLPTTVRQEWEKLAALPTSDYADVIEELRSLKPFDFVEAAEGVRLKAAFDAQFKNGASNVNTWGAIGSASSASFGSARTGLGGGAGSVVAGIPGYIIGVIGGKWVDAYGPAISKKILDQVLTIRGIPKASKIMNLDLPPSVKADLVREWNQFLSNGWVGEPIKLESSDIPVLREDIRRDPDMAPNEKAKIINEINRTGTIKSPELIWGKPSKEQEKSSLDQFIGQKYFSAMPEAF